MPVCLSVGVWRAYGQWGSCSQHEGDVCRLPRQEPTDSDFVCQCSTEKEFWQRRRRWQQVTASSQLTLCPPAMSVICSCTYVIKDRSVYCCTSTQLGEGFLVGLWLVLVTVWKIHKNLMFLATVKPNILWFTFDMDVLRQNGAWVGQWLVMLVGTECVRCVSGRMDQCQRWLTGRPSNTR